MIATSVIVRRADYTRDASTGVVHEVRQTADGLYSQ